MFYPTFMDSFLLEKVWILPDLPAQASQESLEIIHTRVLQNQPSINKKTIVKQSEQNRRLSGIKIIAIV